MTPPLDEELQANAAQIRALQADLKAARALRTRLILRAIGLGWRQVRIAELTGLDRSRIHQMVYSEKKEKK